MAFNLEIDGKLKSTTKGNADWYYGGGNEAWVDEVAAKQGVPQAVREGKTIGILMAGEVVEYIWHPNDTTDEGLVLKTSASQSIPEPTTDGNWLRKKAGNVYSWVQETIVTPFSGAYEELTGKPTLGSAAATNASDYATAAQGEKADTAIQAVDLHAVATTGEYNDLTGKPSFDAVIDLSEDKELKPAQNKKTLYLSENNLTVTISATQSYASSYVFNLTVKHGYTGTFVIASGVALEDGTSAGLTVELTDKAMIHVFKNAAGEFCVRGN